MSTSIELIDIDLIDASPYQPRQDSFDEEKLHEMAKSIESVGILHPPLVRKGESGRYELIAGERRYRAAKIAGLTKLPVCIQPMNNSKSSLAALIENLQRVNLNPVEFSKALEKLLKEHQLTHTELAQKLGMKRTTLSNQLRLLSLPHEIQKSLIEKGISLGHAKVILSIDNSAQQMTLFRHIIHSNLSVRAAEKKSKEIENQPLKKSPSRHLARNIFLQQIRDSLQVKMGTRIDFVGDEKKGAIQLHYYSLSDLNRLLHELGYSAE